MEITLDVAGLEHKLLQKSAQDKILNKTKILFTCYVREKERKSRK